MSENTREKYTIGIDFGTGSARAVIINVKTGELKASAMYVYPHDTMTEQLPDGTKLGKDYALQHPMDYLEALEHAVPEAMELSGLRQEDIIGVAASFTSSTYLPIKKDLTPLCTLPEFASNPHAYVKLWKHHSPGKEADQINEVIKRRDEKWVRYYGNRITSEYPISKVLETLHCAPEVYRAADYYIEAGDWITAILCGKLQKSICAAGYKGFCNWKTGYPDREFYEELHPELANYVSEKLNYPMIGLGEEAGKVCGDAARRFGLPEGCAVAPFVIDSFAGVAGAGIDRTNIMLSVLGTSGCHLILSKEEHLVPGIFGMSYGGIYPGFFSYEAGQSALGDLFEWQVKNCMPEDYAREAEKESKDSQQYLSEKAAELKPGETGIVALDWWNGNRSILLNSSLTGLMVGMTLQTKAEHIYRALLEATAFSTRKIVENYRDHGVNIDAIYATGGISQKNMLLMQIYADVLNLPLRICGGMYGCARGSAAYAAVAAGKETGGYDDILEAARHIGLKSEKRFFPNPENVEVYNKLYEEYSELHDHFGRGRDDVMQRLLAYRSEAVQKG